MRCDAGCKLKSLSLPVREFLYVVYDFHPPSAISHLPPISLTDSIRRHLAGALASAQFLCHSVPASCKLACDRVLRSCACKLRIAKAAEQQDATCILHRWITSSS